MTMDPDTPRPEAEEQQKIPNPSTAGDDFIPLGGEEDFIPLGAASDLDEDDSVSESDDEASFHPHRITLPTFRQLLSCYPTTVEQVHRRKIMLKLQPKPAKGSKRKAEKKAGSASANARGAALIQKTDFNPSEEKHIRTETEKFLQLDLWRYEGMPRILEERKGATAEKGEGAFLNKEELVTVMDWKTRHGLPRPTLMGMVKSNQNNLVLKCTSAAIAALPTEDPALAPNEAFPMASLDALNPLRGVGPATASLILSIVTASGDGAQQVPFYSDDLYLWLCLKDYPETESTPKALISTGGTAESPVKPKKKVSKYKRPNGELNVKYNLHEYRQLWNASCELRQRLNRSVEDEAEKSDDEEDTETSGPVSLIDIEKVAYVLRNIAVSGYYPDVDPEAILQAKAEQQAKVQAAAAADGAKSETKKASKKRKRQEKDAKKQQGGRNKKQKA